MPQVEKVHSRVEEAEEIIAQLCEEYPEALWAVNPNIVAVLGVENKERPKNSKKLATIRPVKGINKSLMILNNIPVRYVIEIYWDEWNKWSQSQKVVIMFHEVLHIGDEIGKTVKHDLEDFKIMINSLGVDWYKNPNLPNLLNEHIDFDLSLRPNVNALDLENLKVGTGDEIM